MKAAILNIVFIVLAGIIFLAAHYMPPFIEQNPPLQAIVPAGIRLQASAKTWDLKNWQDRSFQQTKEDLLRDEPYMRSFSVRLKNEALYSLFDHNANPKVAVGKEGYLYDPSYVNAYLGLNNQTDSVFERSIARIGQLKAELDAVGTPLLILLPPPKAYIYPTYLPRSYQRLEPQKSDRLKIAAALKEQGIAYMDFDFYRKLATQSPTLLYPKTGLHWSHYGAYLALDSLRGTLSQLFGRELPRLALDSLRFTNRLRPPDNELAELSNLWRDYPYDTMAYPHFQMLVDSNSFRPKVLTIADSYYHLWVRHHYLDGLFDDSSQEWFYNGRSFSKATPAGAPIDRSAAALKKAVADADVLILEASATNLRQIDFFGFVEQYLRITTD